MLRRLIAPALALALLPGTGAASVEDAKAARVMWTAFECGKYAELTGKRERAAELYTLGTNAGWRFYRALEAGTITDAELAEHAPFVLTSLTAGPSVDFILGRVFQYATDAAQETVVKKDAFGLPTPISDWLVDPAEISARADEVYQKRNCALL